MARRRAHLNHAPIVEAVIDYRVIPRDSVSPDDFNAVKSQVGPLYPESNPMQSLEARFGLQQGRLVDSKAVQSVGLAFKSASAVAQFRIDGFTFNKLEPYTSWEEVFAEASRLWQVYVQAARPLELTRVAVRYINRLRLPGPSDLTKYLTVPPLLPSPIPQRIQEYLTRFVIVDATRNASAVIIQALEASLDATIMPLLFDIDAFRENVALAVDDFSVASVFEALRDLKNEIFFATLTEPAVEMYA